jgi:signal transduction histidine kinase
MDEGTDDRELERRAHAEVLSVVSHDIRAPLGVILGAVTELANPQLGPLTEEQRSLVALVRRSSEKLQRLATNVLLLNRLALGRLELQRQRVDARTVLRRTIESFERAGELGRLRVTTSVPDAGVDVDADPERLGQALVNVLANAVRFARAEVRASVARDDGVAVFVVEDDGPGLTPAQIAILFDREARLRPTSNGAPTMRGLGLPIVSAIVRAHGGDVSAESIGDATGRTVGARVRLTLRAL